MELYLAADRIWYSAYEEERDRPCLGYIRGNKFRNSTWYLYGVSTEFPLC